MTIGGDDTAFSASRVAAQAGGTISVVHVPKTIDNDLPLPGGIVTFGFETARHVGVSLVETIMEDARATSRWYLLVAMGRKAGHLALGIGKAAGATLTLIPEEFRRKSRSPSCGRIEARSSSAARWAARTARSCSPTAGLLDPRPPGIEAPSATTTDTRLSSARQRAEERAQAALARRISVKLVARTSARAALRGPDPVRQRYTRDPAGAARHSRGRSDCAVTRQNGKIVAMPSPADGSQDRTHARLVDVRRATPSRVST
jgi:6-phosphofructokinase 1